MAQQSGPVVIDSFTASNPNPPQCRPNQSSEVTLTATIRNTSNTPVTNLLARLEVPHCGPIDVISLSPDPITSNIPEWQVSSLQPGQSITFTARIKVLRGDPLASFGVLYDQGRVSQTYTGDDAGFCQGQCGSAPTLSTPPRPSIPFSPIVPFPPPPPVPSITTSPPPNKIPVIICDPAEVDCQPSRPQLGPHFQQAQN
ncbi:MAG: hypothetical protein ACREQV_06015, partial [Candidatus Binatia bacterium]